MHRILLVDDDHYVRVTLRDTLEAEGFSVISAGHGNEGVSRLRELNPAPCLVILDQMMPLMGAEGFLIEKGADPKLAKIPVILISGLPNKSDDSGVAAYLKKPIEVPALLNVIRELCDQHQ